MRQPVASLRWISALTIVVVLAAVAVLVPTNAEDAQASVPPLVSIEEGGLRYEFHLPTGMEGLFVTAEDVDGLHNVVDDRPDEARQLREKLSRKYGVKDVEELREQYRDTTETLRGLGYL